MLTAVLIAVYSLPGLIMDHQMRDVAVDFVLLSCSLLCKPPSFILIYLTCHLKNSKLNALERSLLQDVLKMHLSPLA